MGAYRTALIAASSIAAQLIGALWIVAMAGTPAAAQSYTASPDADALARLAPPSRRGTELQTYGDAAYARDHMAGRGYRGYGYGTAQGEGYAYQPPDDGYRPFYTDFPAYVSAPQIYKRIPDTQTPILPLGDH